MQATALWPGRNRASDGLLPSRQHYASNPDSDHNNGYAFDLTHDPEHGVDCAKLSRYVMNDPRTKYVIFNREIWSRVRAREGWRRYTGTNPHTKHMHVSILPGHGGDVSAWWTRIEQPAEPAVRKPPPPEPKKPTPTPTVTWERRLVGSLPLLKRGAKGPAVKTVQALLVARGHVVGIDGDFGAKTDSAVRQFQTIRLGRSAADGVVGPVTYTKLLGL